MHIESDWQRLYRNLPFIPPRGEKTKDKDIEEFMHIVSRIGVPEVVIRLVDEFGPGLLGNESQIDI